MTDPKKLTDAELKAEVEKIFARVTITPEMFKAAIYRHPDYHGFTEIVAADGTPPAFR